MNAQEIPERDPVGDVFTGSLLRLHSENVYFLSVTPLPGVEVVLNDIVLIRYGIRYLGKPHLSIVPGLMVLDYGAILTGEEALYYALKKGDRYPRADIVGYRNDGQDEMIVMKKLDTALPLEVLAFKNHTDTKSVAGVKAIIISEAEAKSNSIPPRILEHLAQYPTLDDWKINQNE